MKTSSLPPETQLLKKLWINRYKVLTEADRLLGTNKFNDIADAYLKCAEELENPPLDLLKQFEDYDINKEKFAIFMKEKDNKERDDRLMREKQRLEIAHAKFINDVQS